MSAVKMREAAEKYATPGGLLALAVSILVAPYLPGREAPAPQYNGVTFQALVTSVDRMDGSVTTLANTVSTTFVKVTDEIRDGQRRADWLELQQDSNRKQIEALSRGLDDIRSQIQDLKVQLAKGKP